MLQIRPGRLVVHRLLVVSFQRFIAPPSGRLEGRVPASLGALPIGVCAEGQPCVPLFDGEAFWIGFELEDGVAAPVQLELTIDNQDASSMLLCVPPARMLAAWRGGDGSERVFDRFACSKVFLAVRGAGAFSVRLLSPVDFSLLTGLEAPRRADPGDGYGGWRLP